MKIYFLTAIVSLVMLAAMACSVDEPESQAAPSTPLPAPTAAVIASTPVPPEQPATPFPAAPAPTLVVPTPTLQPTVAPPPTPRPVPTAAATPTSTSTSTPAPSQEFTSSVEVTDCADFDGPDSPRFECGFLTVPEDRSQSNERTIKIAFMMVHAASDDPAPDPVVYLSGGPGENAIGTFRFLFGIHFSKFIDHRDLIIVDQRGTGFSQPALDCPELIELGSEFSGQDLSQEEGYDLGFGALMECRDRLLDEGVNLAAFKSAESAADLNDLREALGYDEWNLYGGSYGTRLALTAMRDFDDGIRSAILDSTYPLQVNLYSALPANAQRGFDTLFDACAADPKCSEAYPELENLLNETAEQLDENPAVYQVTNPLTNESLDVLLKGESLKALVFALLYSTNAIPSLPKIIYDANNSDFNTLALLQGSLLLQGDLVSAGMQLSVQCNEEIPFTSFEELTAATDAYPFIGDFTRYAPTLGPRIVDVCDMWLGSDVEAPPIENEPVISDVPALVLSGEHDPITPPDWGTMVSDDLPNSYFYLFPGTGHGASFGIDCSTGIALAFLDDPASEPDSTCIAGMAGPQFAVAETEITLVPYTSETFGISGVVPEGWLELAPGAFGQSALGEVLIVQQAAPESLANLLALISNQLGLSEVPEAVDSRTSENYTWSLYEATVQTLAIELALAEYESGTIIVIMQSGEDDREFFKNEVFLPVIDALTAGDADESNAP